jgi:hypothetical protein
MVLGTTETPRSAIISARSRYESFVLEVPAHAQYDDLGIEMAALEELVDAQQLAHQAQIHEDCRTSASTRGLQQNPQPKARFSAPSGLAYGHRGVAALAR